MMTTSKLASPATRPASAVDSAHASKADKYATNPSGVVIGLTLGMAWQLAAVVLVPIFGGYLLDNKFNSSPTLTLIGLGLAMIFMVLIIRRTLQSLNEYVGQTLPNTRPEVKK